MSYLFLIIRHSVADLCLNHSKTPIFFPFPKLSS